MMKTTIFTLIFFLFSFSVLAGNREETRKRIKTLQDPIIFVKNFYTDLVLVKVDGVWLHLYKNFTAKTKDDKDQKCRLEIQMKVDQDEADKLKERLEKETEKILISRLQMIASLAIITLEDNVLVYHVKTWDGKLVERLKK